MGCGSCVQKANARRKELDKIIEKAEKKALTTNEDQVICKKESKGKFFICSPGQARANHYIILEIIPGLLQVPA